MYDVITTIFVFSIMLNKIYYHIGYKMALSIVFMDSTIINQVSRATYYLYRLCHIVSDEPTKIILKIAILSRFEK